MRPGDFGISQKLIFFFQNNLIYEISRYDSEQYDKDIKINADRQEAIKY